MSCRIGKRVKRVNRQIRRKKRRGGNRSWIVDHGEGTRFRECGPVPRSQQALRSLRQLAVLRSGSAVFRVIYSREMARFLVYILEPGASLFRAPCNLSTRRVPCRSRADSSSASSQRSRSRRAVNRATFSHIGAVHFLAS